MRKTILLCFFLSILTCRLRAQENYEIQVYGAETVEAGHTMLELHSNFTANGSTSIEDGQLPTNHVFHETIDV